MEPFSYCKGRCCGTCIHHKNDYGIFCKKHNFDTDETGCCADWEENMWSKI